MWPKITTLPRSRTQHAHSHSYSHTHDDDTHSSNHCQSSALVGKHTAGMSDIVGQHPNFIDAAFISVSLHILSKPAAILLSHTFMDQLSHSWCVYNGRAHDVPTSKQVKNAKFDRSGRSSHERVAALVRAQQDTHPSSQSPGKAPIGVLGAKLDWLVDSNKTRRIALERRKKTLWGPSNPDSREPPRPGPGRRSQLARVKSKRLDIGGIDPPTSRMRSGRSTI